MVTPNEAAAINLLLDSYAEFKMEEYKKKVRQVMDNCRCLCIDCRKAAAKELEL